jgi:hypothetical protein
MKKIIPILIAVALCFAATGCATLSSLNAIDTGTAVSSANFHYVKSVEGVATSTYFLGFAGGDDAGKAIADAKQKADLKDNQALVNVAVVNTQRIILGIVIKVKTTVSADVIEFEK